MNLIDFGTIGDIKRHLETLFERDKKVWIANLPDIKEIKPNKVKHFDFIIQHIYFKFVIIDVSHNCLMSALDKHMKGYLPDDDYNMRIEAEKANYILLKESLLNELKYLKR